MRVCGLGGDDFIDEIWLVTVFFFKPYATRCYERPWPLQNETCIVRRFGKIEIKTSKEELVFDQSQ